MTCWSMAFATAVPLTRGALAVRWMLPWMWAVGAAGLVRLAGGGSLWYLFVFVFLSFFFCTACVAVAHPLAALRHPVSTPVSLPPPPSCMGKIALPSAPSRGTRLSSLPALRRARGPLPRHGWSPAPSTSSRHLPHRRPPGGKGGTRSSRRWSGKSRRCVGWRRQLLWAGWVHACTGWCRGRHEVVVSQHGCRLLSGPPVLCTGRRLAVLPVHALFLPPPSLFGCSVC